MPSIIKGSSGGSSKELAPWSASATVKASNVISINKPVSIVETADWGGTLVKLPDISSDLYNKATACEISPDGRYIAIGRGYLIYVYYINDDGSYTLISGAQGVGSSNTINRIRFSPDSKFLCVAASGSTRILFYSLSPTILTKMANPATLPTGTANDCAFSNDGKFLVISHTTSPYITIYSYDSSGTLTKLANPSSLPSGTGQGCAFSNDSSMFIVSQVTDKIFSMYTISGTTFAKAVTYNPNVVAYAMEFSPDDTMLICALSADPAYIAYKVSGTTLTTINLPIIEGKNSASSGQCCDFSLDGRFAAFGFGDQYNRSLYLFRRVEDTLVLIGQLPDHPTGSVYGVDFSKDTLITATYYSTSTSDRCTHMYRAPTEELAFAVKTVNTNPVSWIPKGKLGIALNSANTDELVTVNLLEPLNNLLGV